MLGKKCKGENGYIRTMKQKNEFEVWEVLGECNMLMDVGAVLDSRTLES